MKNIHKEIHPGPKKVSSFFVKVNESVSIYWTVNVEEKVENEGRKMGIY